MNYDEYVEELVSLCKDKDLNLRWKKLSNGYKFYYINIGERKGAEKSVCVSAGIHGNEPAGPLAVLEYLKKFKKPKCHTLIYPVANPHGFDKGVRPNSFRQDINRRFCDRLLTGEAGAIYNLATKFKIQFLCTLHESRWSKDQFYMYASDRIMEATVIQMAKRAGKYFDLATKDQINKEDVMDGVIWHPEKGYQDERSRSTLENRMYTDGVHYVCTETPAEAELDKRVKCQTELLNFTLEHFGD